MSRDLRLLVDRREDLVAERTRHISRLRWHLHDIDPSWDPQPRTLTTMKHLRLAEQRLEHTESVVARIASDLVRRIRELTATITDIEAELDQRTFDSAPHLRAVHGVAAVSAAKIIGEVAGATRFRSRHAFARHNGTAPTPVWSSNSPRHRLSKTGNRQLNAAIHRIALTQARSLPQARDYLDKREQAGATRKEPLRCLKRRLSDVVFRAMLADHAADTAHANDVAA